MFKAIMQSNQQKLQSCKRIASSNSSEIKISYELEEMGCANNNNCFTINRQIYL